MGITLVEGAFDAIAVRNNAIPLFGKYISTALLEKLKEKNVSRVNICLDDDAMKDSIKLYEILHKNNVPDIHLIKLNGKDPSVLGFKKVSEIIETSKPTDFGSIISHKLNLI